MKVEKKIIVATLAFTGLITLMAGCGSQKPPKAVPVTNFDKDRYLGKWYEIARFDFSFERNLNNTTANYSLNKDGSIRVINKGYNYKKKHWSESTGKAKFVGDPTVAMLKVSFFGPFYSGYNVIDLDDDYRYALIAGKSLDYLWILSRETTIPAKIKDRFLKKAVEIGFDVDKLIWVEHTPANK
ncbi:lipocalin family protein [Porphyromonas pogonae]|uniref:lipocalin family protein n=1 Tax=Porphyromonas pogonae TaxID=867595 RepID=UPI002E7A1D42|nr:lipocalin family protein [Porphyromonas pogonae]